MQQEPSFYPTREPLGKTVLRMQMRPGVTEPNTLADQLDRMRSAYRHPSELLVQYEQVLTRLAAAGRAIYVPPSPLLRTPVWRIYICLFSSCGNMFRSRRTDRKYCSRRCVWRAVEERKRIKQRRP